MWSSSVWGFFGLGVTFALARVSMIWTQGHEWIGPWLSGASGACFVVSLVVLLAPLMQARKVEAPPPRPDMPIHEAIEYIVEKSATRLHQVSAGYNGALVGSLEWVGEDKNHAVELIRDKAMAGELRLWGKRQIGEASAMTFDTALQEVPQDYWREANLNAPFCFDRNEHGQTYSVAGRARRPKYSDLHLSMAQVGMAWPRKAVRKGWRRWLWTRR